MINELSVTWDRERVSISLRAALEYGQSLPVEPTVLDGSSPQQSAYRKLEAVLAEYLTTTHLGRPRRQEPLDRPCLFGDRYEHQHIPGAAA
jgi:hypothetical protein